MNIIFELITLLICCHSYASLKLTIVPSEKNMVVGENESLNLTCKIVDPEGYDWHECEGIWSGEESISYRPGGFMCYPCEGFPLSWTLPIKKSTTEGRVSVHEGYNQKSIFIHKLYQSDTGEYICELNKDGIKRISKVNILVRAGKPMCLKPKFTCENGLCISRNYVCDGYLDCPDGSDEFFKHCGSDPCKGKFLCQGRCISKKLCCNPAVDPNCSANYLMPCCDWINHSDTMTAIVRPDTPDKYHNLGFYRSTVYTMISCAVAFIFMSAVMLIVVCRFRVRNSPWFFPASQSATQRRFWQDTGGQNHRRGNSANSQGNAVVSLQNRFHNVDQSEMLDPLENFVLLTFDASTGFEIAEYGPKPPPYTENNIGVPPPPYSSTIDVSAENPATERSSQPPVETSPP